MDYTKMLKEILASTHWTQEKLAAKLGVSFATVNYWLNGKTKPQKNIMKDIEKLYLAQDVTGEDEPTYITLIATRPSEMYLEVGDYVKLIKDTENDYDDEAILVESGSGDKEIYEETYDGVYVANSVSTVARGTKSAGRIYDKFDNDARAQVMFVHKNIAICRVTSWEG